MRPVPTLALLPLGSGDDFAKVCGIPRTVISACDAILFGSTREVDVATADPGDDRAAQLYVTEKSLEG